MATKEYLRDYRVKNKDKIKKYNEFRKVVNRDRIRLRKFNLIELKGSECYICKLKATKENSCVFDFHHIKEKLFNLAPYTRNMEDLISEIDKCILVCSNCHRLLHKDLI